MKKKKLPEIIITGTPQELVEIESLLVMAGYDTPDENWNNHQIKMFVTTIYCDSINKKIEYHNHDCSVPEEENFKASEIHKILHYIETGEIKEYFKDTAYFKERQEWIERAIGKLEESSIKCITGKMPFYFDRSTREVSTKKPIKYTPETKTHTGQAGVVGTRPVNVFESSLKKTKKGFVIDNTKPKQITSTFPVNPKYTNNWDKIEKAFKEWSNPKKKNCIGYYSPTQQMEILAFFKSQFNK
jgi:hypothetical protein